MAGRASQHPLPTPPGQPQNSAPDPSQEQYYQSPRQPAESAAPAQQRNPPRRNRTFSFRSDKSHKSRKSSDGPPKLERAETHLEKEAHRLHSKADPTLAMNEAEPAAVAATVKSSLASLRNMQHKDAMGNPIAEPDLSNPTRNRWERPLDTIKSFEAAIDGAYNRKSYYRPDSESIATFSRRGSYFAGNGGRPHDSFYASRPQSMFRPESQYDVRQSMYQRDSYMEQQPGGHNSAYGNGYYNTAPPPMPPQHGGRRAYPRMASEPQVSMQRPDPSVYPVSNNHRSYETVASASGSGTSGEPGGYQTDPTSSDNSSVERMQQRPFPTEREPEAVNDYGIGFSQNSSYQPAAFTLGTKNANGNGRLSKDYPRGPTPGHDVPPPVPKKGATIARKMSTIRATQASPTEKRKSWLSRRFSKD